MIAEKPSVAQSIAAVLGAKSRHDGYLEGGGYIVSWCFGHLAELADAAVYNADDAKWTLAALPIIPTSFRFIVRSEKQKQFDILRELMRRGDMTEVVNACDAGREGELIFRTVYCLVGCSKPILRLWISSMEDDAIRSGFQQLRSGRDYDGLHQSALCRAKADWLVGINATRYFSLTYGRTLNIGRVMSPTLALLVQREAEISAFVAEPFYTVQLDCGFPAATDRMKDRKDADAIANACKGKTVTVKSVERKEKSEKAPALYDLTALQRDANRVLGYTSQQTLDYLQALYEKNLCTYPRTDSCYITDDMEQTADDMVRRTAAAFKFGADYDAQGCTPDIKRLINNEKVSDHHALLPTKEISRYDFTRLPEDCWNVLSLIAIRLLLAVSPVNTCDSVTAVLECGGMDFTARGKTVVQGGWKQLEATIKAGLKGLSQDADEDDAEEASGVLPPLVEGAEIPVKSVKPLEHKTTPPKRYTEDMLLSAMERAGSDSYDDDDDVEKKGLGTPATRAAIIETLVKRQYVERKGKQLIPTDKGIRVIDVVPEKVKSAAMTAEWESTLQKIAKGEADDQQFLSDIIAFTKQLIRENAGETSRNENPFRFSRLTVIGKCPNCGKNVYEFPKSYSCEDSRGACGFYFPREIWGKEVSETQAKRILDKGSSITLKGFLDRSGNACAGKLVLKDGRVRVELEK